MFDCEVGDLIHWGAIGAIKLCLRDPGYGIIHPSSVLSSSCEILWDGSRFINPNADKLAPMDEQYKRVFSQAVKNEKAEISKYCSLFFDRNSLTCTLPKQFNLNDFIDAGGEFFFDGFWELDGVDSIEGGYHPSKPLIFPYGSSQFLHGWLYNGIDLSSDEFNPSEQLWIMSPDLIALNNAINDGSELPNIFNSDEIAAQARKQEQQRILSKQNQPTIRISDQHARLTVALMQSIYKDAELRQPYKLHGVMEVGISGYPVADGKTLKSILEKGGWDSFDE